jgi:hypothetical protein
VSWGTRLLSRQRSRLVETGAGADEDMWHKLTMLIS